jgi:Ni,Fe-hydrogenase III small subunit
MGVYDCTCHGAIFSDPMNTQEVVVGMVGYVYDNNNKVNGTPSEPIQTIVQRSQNNTQLWNDLIHATGGKLNLEKSFFQVLAYDFTKKG